MRHVVTLGLAVLVAMAGVVCLPPPLAAQEGDRDGERDGGTIGESAERGRLAPTIPADSQPVDLLLAVPDTDPPAGSDLEVVRYGQAGRLSRPNALDIPERPQALQLAEWDWLRPLRRDMELAARDPYRIWLELRAGMQGVLVSSGHLELFWGTVEWQDTTDSAAERHISAGDVLIRGRGTARITRDVRGVRIAVNTGRFELEEGGRLTTVVGAGQEYLLSHEMTAPERSMVAEETLAAAERMREVRRTTLEILLDGETETPDGNTLSLLWERAVALGPWYSYAEDLRVSDVPHPDLILRDLGEVLRLLAAFRFSPPPAMGM
ncbi:MAG: hypothetical protein R6U25_03935 [Alkalispirochaeta sp.]